LRPVDVSDTVNAPDPAHDGIKMINARDVHHDVHDSHTVAGGSRVHRADVRAKLGDSAHDVRKERHPVDGLDLKLHRIGVLRAELPLHFDVALGRASQPRNVRAIAPVH